MDLAPYVSELHRQLAAAAEAHGEEAREHAERFSAALDASARLMLLDALSAAAGEITAELAPGAVDLRLRGGEPEWVVTPAPQEAEPAEAPAAAWTAGDESATARINLRLPERLKARVEDAAGAAGLSVNAWLVRALAAAVEPGTTPAPGRSAGGGGRFTGWVS
jgi:HicB family